MNSDNQRIIFPLLNNTGIYDHSDFNPALIDNRMKLSDIQTLLDQIHRETNFLAPIRTIHMMGPCILAVFSLFIISELSLAILALNDMIEVYYIFMSLLALFIVFFFIIACYLRYSKQALSCYEKIKHIIDMNRVKFQRVGLTWVLPKNFRYLELRLDYKKEQEQKLSHIDEKQKIYEITMLQTVAHSDIFEHQYNDKIRLLTSKTDVK